MPKAIMTVRSSPVSSAREAEYNAWYDQAHIPQVSQIAGFVGVSRYKLQPSTDTDLPTYLTIYELDADDPAEPVAEMRRRVASGDLSSTDTIATEPKPESAIYLAV
ncbi:MAG: hypothetical protein JWO57_1803 [Pseudonocardiales bacterium]|nr:hypothetical protein [Pseudonocardiales bacterium]